MTPAPAAPLSPLHTPSNAPVRRYRVALVHDWLTGMRGGERVLESFCRLYPDAELFTLLHKPGSVSPLIEGMKRHVSPIQQLPYAHRYYRQYLPLFPFAVEQFDLDGFDLVISTSHCVAKSAVKAGHARHLCYCFTPMRYAWDQFDAYFGLARLGRLGSAFMRPTMAALARWDAATATRPDRYIAISQYVARRIHRYYNRRAVVVYPPVDTEFYHPNGVPPERYFLVVSALVPYKRVDLAIEACRLANVPLRIVGQGPELAHLSRLAGPSVEFLGRRTNEEIRELYRRATAILLPGEEDFGIVPVEAQACGRPVIGLARGGTVETVIDEATGILVAEASADALAKAVNRVKGMRFDSHVARHHALKFSEERFAREIRSCVDALMTSPDEAARC